VSTTVSGVSYDKSGKIALLNCGGPGWLVTKNGKCQHWLGRGGILGLSPLLSVPVIDFQLQAGDFVVGVTDGIASSLRDMRHILRMIDTAAHSQNDIDDISAMIMGRPSVELIADDRAIICLGKVA
jgi:serine phosphatase RsbU (regulator of sigma subunit)